jgi:secreted Zn-dependent insulinase-like peptidase
MVALFTNYGPSEGETHRLSLPIINTYFPKNLDLLPSDPEYEHEPRKIFENEGSRIYYKKDGRLGTRMIYASNYMYLPVGEFTDTVKGKVFVELWIDVLDDYFKQFLYTPQYALSCFSWKSLQDGIVFNFSCYSDTFKHFVSK